MRKTLLRLALAAALGLGLWWSRRWIGEAASQLLRGMLLALVAWPLMKRLQRRLSDGFSAALALVTLLGALVAGLTLLAPPVIRQGRELLAVLPQLVNQWEQFIPQQSLWNRVESAIPAVAGWLGGVAGSVGQWMLSPVIAFYLLRDRRRIAQWLLLLLPIGWRGMCVHILGQMRREAAAYLRGQMMISLAVGSLTAFGLMLCGVPSWLVLGALMGLLELIPYVGPVIGGAAAVLFALPGGWGRTLWALGVVLAVQQAEGTFLSPKLMSDATRLHPLAVALCIIAGGAAAGVAGILLSVPALLCLRAALRCFHLWQFEKDFSKQSIWCIMDAYHLWGRVPDDGHERNDEVFADCGRRQRCKHDP